MARERILVKDAMYRVKNAIRYFLTPLNNSETLNYLDINTLSFSLRFLSETRKLMDLLAEVASNLLSLQSKLPKGVKKIEVIDFDDDVVVLDKKDLHGAWFNPFLIDESDLMEDPSLEIDKFYDVFFYPTARIIEALSIYARYCHIDDFKNEVNQAIENGVDFLLQIIQKVNLENLCYELGTCVPIVKAFEKSFLFVKEKEAIKNSLDPIKTLVKDFDPEINQIASQDIYYALISMEREFNGVSYKLNERDLLPLYISLKSNVYGKILKAMEYLTQFNVPVPQEVNERLLPMTSKYFKAIFRIANGSDHLKYSSSLAESVYQILKNSNNRAFAESVLNLLTESSGWIYSKGLTLKEFVKIILGSGLLVLARGALRR